MKFKICIILTIILIILNKNYSCFAKYIFTYEQTVFELNIDRTLPQAEILEIINTNKDYEKYASKLHEISVKIKISDNNKLINNLIDFEILVDTKESNCIKEIEILEKTENYIIYQINLTNITENGELFIKIPQNSFKDDSENILEETLINTGILIDNIPPVVKYSQTIKNDGKVLASITSNEEIRNLEGWNFDNTGRVVSKEFISDAKYDREITDLAGNKANIKIDVKESTYLGLDIKAHMSSSAWQITNSDIIGKMEEGNRKYKIESLIFRTGDNVAKDYLQVAGYIYSYWGEDSYGKSGQFENIIYNYGNNPINGYKTMLNSELAKYNGKDYIHLGGEGINFQGNTDINGNNPIPVEIAKQYRYGVSGIRLNLKEHTENSIVYQIFFNDTGWLQACKNGEIAMRLESKTIEAMRVMVVPNSELEFVLQDWNDDIGTYNLD